MQNDRLGIGPIRCDNIVEVTNALNAAMYLVNPEKYAQWLLAKIPYMRTLVQVNLKCIGVEVLQTLQQLWI
jgi:ribosome biogenesis protein Tsr3